MKEFKYIGIYETPFDVNTFTFFQHDINGESLSELNELAADHAYGLESRMHGPVQKLYREDANGTSAVWCTEIGTWLNCVKVNL